MNNVQELILEIKYLIAELRLTEVETKRVIRNKKVVKKKECKKGYKWNASNKKCIKMSPTEILNRRRAQKKASFKRKSKKTQTTRKRNQSLSKRKSSGIK